VVRSSSVISEFMGLQRMHLQRYGINLEREMDQSCFMN